MEGVYINYYTSPRAAGGKALQAKTLIGRNVVASCIDIRVHKSVSLSDAGTERPSQSAGNLSLSTDSTSMFI